MEVKGWVVNTWNNFELWEKALSGIGVGLAALGIPTLIGVIIWQCCKKKPIIFKDPCPYSSSSDNDLFKELDEAANKKPQKKAHKK